MFFGNIANMIWRGVVAVAIAITFFVGTVTPPVLAVNLSAKTIPITTENFSESDGSASLDWEEQYAYTLGVQAFIYAFPWTYMPKLYWDLYTAGEVGLNEFVHNRKLKDATHTEGGSPNNDTLYSFAILDLGNEPIVLSVPEIPERYYTMQIADFKGDNFAYVGKRATGTAAGNYAIVGPNWQGELPADVKALEGSSATPWAFIAGRTLVLEEERQTDNYKEIHEIQDQYKLTPLSQWIDPEAPPPTGPELWEPYPSEDPLADWKNINRAMADNPPDPYDAGLLTLFEHIGIGPGLDIEAQSPSTKRGLARAAVDGLQLIEDAFAAGYNQKQVNGWNYPSPETGRPSAARDWLTRAMQAQVGFLANDPIEAVYLNVSLDGDGNPLSGANRYELRFEKGQQPDVNEFWSVTMYNSDYNLVDNPIDRYSLGDRSDMETAADGSLTIYIQKDPPSDDKLANWLPAPDGNFFMFLRAYLPGYSILSQWWEPPSLTLIP